MSGELTSPAADAFDARQRRILLAVTAAVAVTRLLAMSKTPWDWDEMLFCLAMRNFDVTEHHPHPPGFPVYVALAHLVRLIVPSDFLAFRTINTVAGIMLTPGIALLGRRVGMSFRMSMAAALFTVFNPSIWFYGGTAFSDVTAVTCAVWGGALLLAGGHSRWQFLLGAVIAGAGAGIRPQNALLGIAPALVGMWSCWRQRRTGTAIGGALIMTLIPAVGFSAAALASYSVELYFDAVQWHREYLMTYMSYKAPGRPTLLQLADEFYVYRHGSRAVGWWCSVFALLGGIHALRRQRSLLLLIAMFGPYAVTAILYLDVPSVSRLAIGYVPGLTMFAAVGLMSLHEWFGGKSPETAARRRAILRRVEVGLVTVVTAYVAVWAWGAIRVAVSTPSPPYAATQWAKANVPVSAPLAVSRGMGPFADYYLTTHNTLRLETLKPEPADYGKLRGGFLLTDTSSVEEGAVNFSRRRTRLWHLARRYYVEASVGPARPEVVYTAGWAAPEGDPAMPYRWMGYDGTLLVPHTGSSTVTLRLDLHIPTGYFDHALLTFSWNGVRVEERRVNTGSQQIHLTLRDARTSGNTLHIRTDRVVNLAKLGKGADPRDLGVRVDRVAIE